MDPFSAPLLLPALVFSSYMAIRSVRRKKLTQWAAVVGWTVGVILCGAGLRGYILFGFYLLGSKATQFKAQAKSKLSTGYAAISSPENPAARTAAQVLCVSGIACVLTLVHVVCDGPEQPYGGGRANQDYCLASAIAAHHATSLADTLASEMGILGSFLGGKQRPQPRLITQPWRRVPPGCNGGVTIEGFLWSTVGGSLVGVMAVVLDWMSGIPMKPGRILVLCTLMGLLGSVLDSILGATVQATFWDESSKMIVQSGGKRLAGLDLLSNEQVNLVSTAIATYIGGWVVGPMLFRNPKL